MKAAIELVAGLIVISLVSACAVQHVKYIESSLMYEANEYDYYED